MTVSTGVLLAMLPIFVATALATGRATAWVVVALAGVASTWRLVLDRRRATRAHL